MSDVSLPLLVCSSLVSGALGALVGVGLAWRLLRRGTDAVDAPRMAPPTDLPELLAAALRSDMDRLAQQQARQVDAQVEHLHRWQRDLMQFLDDSHRRQMAEWRLLLSPKGAATKPSPATSTLQPAPAAQSGNLGHGPGSMAGAPAAPPSRREAEPIPKPPLPPPPAQEPPIAPRELTDEEIDALPPELPPPVTRKRLAQAPTKPVMRNL